MAEDELMALRIENGEVREHWLKALAEIEELTEEVSGLLSQVRMQARREQALKRELKKLAGESPEAVSIQILIDNWRHHTGHKRSKCPVDGAGWKVCKRALRDHDVAECLEAIEGIALFPYIVNAQRVAKGSPRDRYDELDHALGDEKRIRAARKLRARAKGATVQMLRDAWAQAEATASLYLAVLQEKW